eukprot:SAG11_NODE_960_length_6382_cov_8.585071_2_plen_245_part_00
MVAASGSGMLMSLGTSLVVAATAAVCYACINIGQRDDAERAAVATLTARSTLPGAKISRSSDHSRTPSKLWRRRPRKQCQVPGAAQHSVASRRDGDGRATKRRAGEAEGSCTDTDDWMLFRARCRLCTARTLATVLAAAAAELSGAASRRLSCALREQITIAEVALVLGSKQARHAELLVKSGYNVERLWCRVAAGKKQKWLVRPSCPWRHATARRSSERSMRGRTGGGGAGRWRAARCAAGHH